MNTCVIDFESYYDQHISLRKLNYTEYVHKTTPMLVATIYQGRITCTDRIAEHLATIDWPNTTLVAHNALFDALLLKQKYGYEAQHYADTLCYARLLHPTIKHDLGTLQECFIPEGQFKDSSSLKTVKGKHFHALCPDDQTQLTAYCRNDVLLCGRLYDLWKDQIPETEQHLIDHTIKTFINPQLILDIEKAKAFLREELRQTDDALIESGLTKETLRSDAQFAKYLESKGYTPPVQFSAKQQKTIPSFSKTSSSFQAFYTAHPELKTLLDLKRRVNSNIKESRTTGLITAAQINNGKIPIAYNYCGAFTGRFSGANKLNMQNLPRGSILRDAIMAPEDSLLVVCDLAQIEARVLAWVAKEDAILETYRQRKDMYCEMASVIFDKPINKKDHPDERFVGKSAVLGLGYSMSAPKFQEYCALQGRTLDLQLCYNVVDTYRKKFPNIPELWKLLSDTINILYQRRSLTINHALKAENGCLILPSQRRLNYQGLDYNDHEQTWRLPNQKKVYGALIVENCIQAISRDILAEQLLTIHRHYPVVMHTHDEIIAIVPETDAEQAKEFILTTMTTTPAWAPGLPLDAEAAIGKRYGDCK